ncbi:MAG TPA: LysE family transporter [Anaerolineales bacterium]|nr:LysE family transporter [Anaerolineales bacterium]
MWLYLLQGIGYGFAAAAQPGPLQTFIIMQSLTRGWQKALPTAFAPQVSDGPIITLCLLVLRQVPDSFKQILFLAGGAFVLYLAYGAYRSWKNFDLNISSSQAEAQQSLLKAALVNVLGPGAYIFWSLVTGPILIEGWRETPIFGITFLLGFYITFVLGLMLIIFVFGTMRALGQKIRRAMIGISALALFGFGFYQLWQGFH